MIPPRPFRPPFFLKHHTIQTLLASLRLRTLGKTMVQQKTKTMILRSNDGTRLMGHYSDHTNRPAKALAILLHGWEGSINSTYMVTCGDYLYCNGFSVFRLNFRDHGDSHQLNEGLFYATLLDEVFDVVDEVANRVDGIPVYLVGFSLGGNFAIRIAAKYADQQSCPLSRVVSISPVLDPDKATDKIDANPFILNYFLKKWRRSLNIKQSLYPHIYNFAEILDLGTLRDMTKRLLELYTSYESEKEYFKAYSIPPDLTLTIHLPLTIVTSCDDPIIAVEDFEKLEPGSQTSIIQHNWGGHNGFLESIWGPTWYDRLIVELLNSKL